MSVSKKTTVISDDVSLSPGSGENMSSPVATMTGWHKSVFIELVNGATGPTTAATARIEGSPDNVHWYHIYDETYFPGKTGANWEGSWERMVLAAVQHVRICWIAGVGGDAVTARGELSEVEDVEVPPTSLTQNTTSITTSATQLIVASTTVTERVALKSLSTNSGKIFVGDSGVTTANGYELSAGDEIIIPIDDVNKLYAIADTGTQDLRWFAT